MSRPDSIPLPDPSALLPRPGDLRVRLALALRDVRILRVLLRLSESVARVVGPLASTVNPSADRRASRE